MFGFNCAIQDVHAVEDHNNFFWEDDDFYDNTYNNNVYDYVGCMDEGGL